MILSEISFGDWKLGANDPGLLGWSTTALYVTCALLTFAKWHRERLSRETVDGKCPAFWLVTAIILLLLGLNKQLDLHHLAREVAVEIVRGAGWNGPMRPIMKVLVVSLAAMTVLTLVVAMWAMRKVFRIYLIPLACLSMLAMFMVIRAASFSSKVSFFNSNHALYGHLLLEVAPLLVIAMHAWQHDRQPAVAG